MSYKIQITEKQAYEMIDKIYGLDFIDDMIDVLKDEGYIKKDLKPCPFCGGKAILDTIKNKRLYNIFCSKCKVGTMHEVIKDKVIEKWNKRHDS